GAGARRPAAARPSPANMGRLFREPLAWLRRERPEPLAAIAALGEPQLRRVVADTLEPAFTAGVLVLDGDRVRFSHPLLAAAAYEALTPISRQALHRRLAGGVEDPGQRAHHPALPAPGPGPGPVAALGEAAGQAPRRGGPR